MTLPAPLHDDLWRCESCETTEGTRHCLADFLAYCPEHWPCQCGPRPVGEAETGGRAA